MRITRIQDLLAACMLLVAGCTAVPVAISSLDPNRGRSDSEMLRLCAIDGGLKVFQTVRLTRGQFANAAKVDWSKQEEGREILVNYRLKKTSVLSRPYGFAIYRYVTWIERTSDGARLGEMITYRREGDEILHGKHCPEISEQALMDAVFVAPGSSDPSTLPMCPDPHRPQPIVVESLESIEPKKTRALDLATDKRGLSETCNTRTRVGRQYKAMAKGEVRLSGTTLEFDSDDGNRCYAIAMAMPEYILCSDDAIWLSGSKTVSGYSDLAIQKYSRNGQLVREIIFKRKTPGRIVGYSEKADSIEVEFLSPNTASNGALCYRVPIKRSAENIAAERDLAAESGLPHWLPGCPASLP